VENFKGQGNNTQVAELDLPTVLATMESKKQLVFIDTREAFEFREGHIPGAINLTLRQIESLDENSTVMQSLVDADLVIAYCVKDFRGFEAARKLRKLGVNAAIMNPYGIKGWRNAGLPIVGSRGLSEPAALTAMQSILLDQKLGKDGTAKQGAI